MYERNAIVLERYFDNMFGYNMKNNIKTNFNDYCELIKNLEEYKEISEEEEIVSQEYDKIANSIREIQKNQEILETKNRKVLEERLNIFKNIDDNPEQMQRKLDSINKNIQEINEQINVNSKKYVDTITEFNEKTSIRITCERNKRRIETNYNKVLNSTLDDFQDIGINFVKEAKQFIEEDTSNIEEELILKIEKNGEKEKIPFNNDVVTKAIALSIDIQKRETDILYNIYEKTNKLFAEIKNNDIKVEKHNKAIKDAKCKLDFINSIKDYLIQFLDNERITAVNGEKEHSKLMEEACKNLEEDLVQINNLYTLLLKEISKKASKKSYTDLYNIGYLGKLEEKSNQYNEELKKLKLPVTVINPNYWRIEGMKKIYDVFYNSVTEVYGRDLSEYNTKKEDEDDFDDEDIEDFDISDEKIETKQKVEKTKANSTKKTKSEDITKSEIDRKIDMILGFDEKGKIENIDEEDWDEDDFNDDDFEDNDYEEETNYQEEEDDFEDEIEDDEEFDIFGEDDLEEVTNDELEDEEDDDEQNEDNDKEDEEDDDDEDEEDDEEEDIEQTKDSDEENDENKKLKKRKHKKNTKKSEDVSFDIWGNKIKEPLDKENSKEDDEDNWENEFINIDKKSKKDKTKKKKGFFEKFKK